MRIVSLTLYTVLLLAGLTACGGDSAATEAEAAAAAAVSSAEEQAYATMWEGHDRAMPMMGKITQLQRTIMDELQAQDIQPERKELLVAANEQLEDAGDGMMEWMNQVKTLDELREDMNNEAILTYIREEAAKIAAVETDMTASITTAGELLGMEAAMGHGDDHDHDHSHDGHDHSHDH